MADIEQELVMLRLEVQKPGFVPLEVMWDNARAEVPVAIPREYTITIEPGSDNRRDGARMAARTTDRQRASSYLGLCHG